MTAQSCSTYKPKKMKMVSSEYDFSHTSKSRTKKLICDVGGFDK